LDRIAWHKDNSAGRAQAVGQKEPNAWMFYDMIGNVAEWCQDDHQPYPRNPAVDWIGANSSSALQLKIIRGGMWTALPSDGSFRCSCRMSFLSDKGLPHLGFRVSLRIPEEGEI
jgi:formylglycine-generating enzyme required for sulfatase activity